MSSVERLGRTLSETVGVGEEGDCGPGVHNDMSTSIENNNDNNGQLAKHSFHTDHLIRVENRLTVVVR